MTIQNCLHKDRQITQDHFPNGKEFFLENNVDTIKVDRNGKRSYAHFYGEGVETFNTKRALRRALSQETGGAWVEEKGGKKRYFIEDSGWFRNSYRKVTKDEYLRKLETRSTMQKVLGLGLGILVLAPGVTEFARHMPFGTKEAAAGLLAFQQKNPLLGTFFYGLNSPVLAQNSSDFGEFQINSFQSTSAGGPSVAPLLDGGFVVSWYNYYQDGSSTGIFGQKFASNGSMIGTEFQVNTFTNNSQFSAQTASLIDGGFVIVWKSDGQDGDQSGIFGQRYDAAGAPVGLEFQVNTYTPDIQFSPSVVGLSDGKFVVVWISRNQGRSGNQVIGQIFDEIGQPFSSEFDVSSVTSGGTVPQVAALPNGRFIVTFAYGPTGGPYYIAASIYNSSAVTTIAAVNTDLVFSKWDPHASALIDGGYIILWESDDQDGDENGIFGQRFHPNNTKLGPEFQVNTLTLASQNSPKVAVLKNGRYVVVWTTLANGGWNVKGQMYESNGSLHNQEFQVSTYPFGFQRSPSIAALEGGGFIVAWESQGDGLRNGIFGKRYDGDGNLIQASRSENPIWRSSPNVEKLSNGGFIAVWESYFQSENYEDIYAQIFGSNGKASTSEFLVNTYTLSSQKNPKVTSFLGGGFLIIWQSYGQDGDDFGIFGQKFSPNGSKDGVEFQANSFTPNSQTDPSVDSFADGGFVVVWDSFNQDGNYSGVYGQRFASNGAKEGLEFRVNNDTDGYTFAPSVAVVDGGIFGAVWYESGLGTRGKIYGRDGSVTVQEFPLNVSSVAMTISEASNTEFIGIGFGGIGEVFGLGFDVNGVFGSPFAIHSPGINLFGLEYSASLTKLSNQEFFVAFTNYSVTGLDILGQRFFPNGTFVGNPFHVNTYTTNDQLRPSTTTLTNGRFVVVWEGFDSRSTQPGIFGQRYDANAGPLSTEFRIPANVESSSFDSHSRQTLASSLVSDTDLRTSTPIMSATLSQADQSSSSIGSEFTIPLVTDIVYGESYSITQNGQVIGTFSISGGDGLYSSTNANILEIQLNPNHQLQDGDTVTLFTVPEGEEEPMWEDVVLNGVDESSCITAEGVFVEDQDEHSYQLVFNFEADSCNVNEGGLKFSVIPALTSGGLV